MTSLSLQLTWGPSARCSPPSFSGQWVCCGRAPALIREKNNSMNDSWMSLKFHTQVLMFPQGWAVCSGKSLLHVPDSLPRHITNLDLSFNALTMPRNGTFLRSFPSLHVLNLSSNIIPTLYPALFRNLKFLHLLDLSNCSMSYMHPNSFLGLRNLHTLLLKNNKLQFLHTSLLPVPRALVHLDLQNNQFSHIDELALLLVQRIHHVKLQGNPWMYNSSLTPFQPERQPREGRQGTETGCPLKGSLKTGAPLFLMSIKIRQCLLFLVQLLLVKWKWEQNQC